jgi:hypothetical protein
LRIQKPLPHFHELLFENGSQESLAPPHGYFTRHDRCKSGQPGGLDRTSQHSTELYS